MRRVVLLSISLLSAVCNVVAQDHVLFSNSVVGAVGDEVQLSNLYTNNTDSEIHGYSWGSCIADPDVIEIVSVSEGMDSTGVAERDSAFFSAVIYPGQGYVVGAVLSSIGDVFIEPNSADLQLCVANYEIVGSGASDVEYCALGNPLVNIAFSDNLANSFVPTVSSGNITTGIAFRRGDADNDGVFSGLLDALFILSYQFNGGPAPTCAEAADVDNDGAITGLTDGVYALTYQFSGGPPPPAPAIDCGAVAPMLLGCDEPTCP